jgi:Phage conserved hypothetical protein BR0599/Uncharacterized conserved protein (DUF2163)
MSAIDDMELSVHDAEPLELYEFLGSYKNYYYTSGPHPIVFNGFTYEPVANLSRNDIRTSTNTEENAALKITMPVTTELVSDYGFQTTPPKLLLNVIRIYRTLTPYETNYRVYWRGPVTNISIKNRNAVLDVPSIFASVMGSACPSFYYQSPCNHVLFSAPCGVSRVSNSVDTTVLNVLSNGQVVRLSSYGAFPPGDYVGGEILIASQNERRMVIGVDAGTGDLTVNYPFGRIYAGLSVQATRGCDHSWKGHCKTRYNNTERFGGHPLIPPVNLFESGF